MNYLMDVMLRKTLRQEMHKNDGTSEFQLDKRNGFQELIADHDNGLIDLMLIKSVPCLKRKILNR